MDDLISRQAALKICRKYWHPTFNPIMEEIEQLPSAQPEIIRCKDCKYAYMTYNGECKYCDIWFPDEKTYMSSDYFCGSAERRRE